ncbi:MAG: ADP-ribosylation factor-like protein [Candidatus Heimdallarchaeaceae archaeon]
MSYLFDELYKDTSDAPAVEDKILLMGLQAAGKTAIKDVVFFDKKPDDAQDYMATVHYQRHFIDEEKKSMVIDSGGQESYWNEAVTHFRHLVFSNVKLLVWVVDVTQPELFEESERRFSFTIRQYLKENPAGHVTVLCHKVDLVTPERMVVIHQHIRELFDDPRFEIEFENTSIYYYESLKDLMFTVMKESGIDTRRFELVSNIGEAVEQSNEFQSYVMEHQEDPRIKQLREFLNPEPEPILPTFGKLDLEFDLTEYDIVEMVLIDKETYSPIIGASSQSNVNIEKSMDYLIGLHHLKSQIRDLGDDVDPTGSIISSADKTVHGMIFNLATNFLLVTSFSEITDQKKEILYELIFKFAQSTGETAPKVEKPPVVAVPVEAAVEASPSSITPMEVASVVSTEDIPIEETPVEVMADTSLEFEVVEDIPVEMTTVELDKETATEEIPEVKIVAEPEPVPKPAQKVEKPAPPAVIEPVAPADSVPKIAPDASVDPKLKGELAAGLSEILEIPTPGEVETVLEGKPEVTEELMQETGTFVSGEMEVTPEEEPAEEVVVVSEEVPAQIDFDANDIKGFASFLMKTKDEVPEGIFSKEAIKSMSDFLTKGVNNNKETKETEEQEE